MKTSALDSAARYAKPFVIVVGFVSSLLGSLGAFLLIGALNDQLKEASDRSHGARQEIDRLGSLASEYFVANQQGDLIYLLGLQGNARPELARLIYQGNILDRATPVRNLLGSLALAKVLDYRATYDAYEKLSDAARASQGFRDFTAVKAFEREVVERAQARVAELQRSLVPLEQSITAIEARLRRRQAILLAFSSIGAVLLLLANLVEHRKQALEEAG